MRGTGVERFLRWSVWISTFMAIQSVKSSDGTPEIRDGIDNNRIDDDEETALTTPKSISSSNSPSFGFSEENMNHRMALDIITTTGSILSITGILLIFLSALLFKEWRKTEGTKILLQLSTAVALEIVMIQVSVLDNVNHTSCQIIGITTHYAVLAKFSWLLIFAFLQYLRFVKVIGPKPNRLVLKCTLFGWIFPALPLIVCLSVDSYSSDEQNCYPQGLNALLGVILPVCVMVAVNVLLFLVIMCKIFNSKVWSESKTAKKSPLYLAVLLFFMLGFPWVLGVLGEMAEGWSRLLFAYLFCVTATVQGFVLFVFYVALNGRVRVKWVEFVKKRKKSLCG